MRPSERDGRLVRQHRGDRPGKPCRAVLAILLLGSTMSAAWLDQQPIPNWNQAGGSIPRAPRLGAAAKGSDCTPAHGLAESPEERLLEKAGWLLFGVPTRTSSISVLSASGEVDASCRPKSFQMFVFVAGRFAGTVSPGPMGTRADGSAGTVLIGPDKTIRVSFDRYAEGDPLCCPSRVTPVNYRIELSDGSPVLTPADPIDR